METLRENSGIFWENRGNLWGKSWKNYRKIVKIGLEYRGNIFEKMVKTFQENHGNIFGKMVEISSNNRRNIFKKLREHLGTIVPRSSF